MALVVIRFWLCRPCLLASHRPYSPLLFPFLYTYPDNPIRSPTAWRLGSLARTQSLHPSPYWTLQCKNPIKLAPIYRKTTRYTVSNARTPFAVS
ncbi:hypothetical protein EDC01DRAFT_644611, partial [Geopyxis carbonaria]